MLLASPLTGNVRELENILESATALSADNPQTIGEKDLKPLLAASALPETAVETPPLSMERLEQIAIAQALRLCQGNRTRAASMLGISRDTLYRKLRHHKDGA
jgi:transcriptional regulator of acetoin/glycerol metabolism